MRNDSPAEVDLRTPDVLLEFNWQRKVKYPSFLEVDLSFCNRSDEIIPRKHFSRAPWEREVSLFAYQDDEVGIARPEEVAQVISHKDDMRLKAWEKFLDLPSMLPDTRVWKFDTEMQGSYRMEFSNLGKYLAVACTMQSSKTIVKIFDVEVGQLKVILRGHHDLIHDISWSQDDNYLVTASADGSAKVWDLTTKETDYADKLNYTENDAMFFISQMLHSSYVHAAKIFPEQSQLDGKLLVATACFDQKVRLWHVMTDQTGIGASLSPILELSI